MNTHVLLRDFPANDVEELGLSQVERLTRDIDFKPISDRIKGGKSGGVWVLESDSRIFRVSVRRRTKRALPLVWKIKDRQTDVRVPSRPQSAPTDAEPRQGQLSLQSKAFHPSTKLLSIWRTNISDLAREGGRKNVELRMAGAADFELAREFISSLEAVIGALAQYLRYEEHPQTTITNGTRFAASFQVALCEEFKIIPDQAYEFLRLLNCELRAAFDAGWEVAGSWGKIETSRTGDLQYTLAPVDDMKDPSFVEGTDEEL
ncbi:hypothetical protein ACQR0V_01250 [Bradyrhizobium sp. HKCCYLS2058]|uniref:hypothetical protein n=1 Tax=unclassified Bradyrhizobium TaxID=2631580 RepID=UPI003EBA80EE